MCLVKGGTVDVLLAANEAAGPIEQRAAHVRELSHAAAQFTLPRFMSGCVRLFRSYLASRPAC